MKRSILKYLLAMAIFAAPNLASAYDFGLVDSAQIFNQYKVTQATKATLEQKKAELQKELESRKQSVQKIDDDYTDTAKRLQTTRDAKKDTKALEAKLADLRKELAQKSGDLQKFFEESQRSLYILEEQEMTNLSKNIEGKVDRIIGELAKKNKLKAVFSKNAAFWFDDKAVYDMTNDVIKALNAGK